MTMLEIYEERKDGLIKRLANASSPFEAGAVAGDVLDTAKYQYLAREENKPLAEKLTELVEYTKAMLPVLAAVNRPKLLEETDGKKKKSRSIAPGLIFLLLGVVAVFAPAEYYIFKNKLPGDAASPYLIAMGVGCGLVLLAGFLLFFRGKSKSKPVVEIQADEMKLADSLENAIKFIDDALAKEREAIAHREKMLDYAMNEDAVRLFSYLMEAKLSNDADYALETLDEVERYLLKQDILIINYSKGNEKYFDFLSGDTTKTLRPAFVRDGKVLARGVAQVKNEESGALV